MRPSRERLGRINISNQPPDLPSPGHVDAGGDQDGLREVVEVDLELEGGREHLVGLPGVGQLEGGPQQEGGLEHQAARDRGEHHARPGKPWHIGGCSRYYGLKGPAMKCRRQGHPQKMATNTTRKVVIYTGDSGGVEGGVTLAITSSSLAVSRDPFLRG